MKFSGGLSVRNVRGHSLFVSAVIEVMCIAVCSAPMRVDWRSVVSIVHGIEVARRCESITGTGKKNVARRSFLGEEIVGITLTR